MTLTIEEFERNGKTQYWIDGHPDGMMGPYDTKREVDEDLKGIKRFERHKDEEDFITTDPDQMPKISS